MITQDCPKCGAPMVERPGRWGRFLGCTDYPRCRGSRKLGKTALVKKPLPTIAQFSEYQENWFDFVEFGNGNGCLIAVAGSGKSTTLVFSLAKTPKNAKVGYLAFGKDIADDLKTWELPGNAHISTFHSLGFSNIRSKFGKVRVDNDKIYSIIDDIGKTVSPDDQDAIQDNASAIVKLVSLCKAKMLLPSSASLEFLSTNYNVDSNGDQALVFDVTSKAFHQSLELTQVIDFGDMIYFCASGMVPCQKFDYLFVDEAQDLNDSQVVMALKSVKENGRILTVGDPYQSIFGFRGADTKAIPHLVQETQAKTLPLSITYRMPRSHVEYVKEMIPEYNIEPWENAKEGTMETIEASQLCQVAQDGDMVLCRRNAPLVSYAFRLLRQGIKVVILGRDIAAGLITIIGKVKKTKSTGDAIGAFLRGLREYKNERVLKLEHAGKSGQAQSLDDKCETIIAIAQEAKSVKDIINKIDSIFSKDCAGVTFSSVHKAKGKEANRVFLLKPGELGSTAKCKNQDEMDQERNIWIVAHTRSKSDLYFVEDKMQGAFF